MDTISTETKIRQVFFAREFAHVEGFSGKLVHYTSADAAISILENKKMWMRNVTCMNDWKEVRYGLELLRNILGQEKVDPIEAALGKKAILWHKIKSTFLNNGFVLTYRTYITCFSQLDIKEENTGQLSMWRGYGNNAGVAIVVKTDKFKSDFDRFNLFSLPVEYWTEEELRNYIGQLAENMKENQNFIMELSDELLQNIFAQILISGAVALKHPGFKEEKEWRIISIDGIVYNSSAKALHEDIRTVKGIPQIIKYIPLTDKSESDEEGFSISENLDHIIIGPTSYGKVIKDALVKVLRKQHVSDADQRIIFSEIPYRG